MPKPKSKPNSRLAVGYLRVSTDDQHNGLEAQRVAIERFAAAQHLQVAAFHEDLGVSGATPVDQRPGLLGALTGLACGAGVLLAAKRDRLARDVIIASTIERLVTNYGARVLTADGLDASSTPEAVLMRTIVDAMAQYERALIASRTKHALAVKRSRGEAIGTAPYGWKIDQHGKLIAVDHEQRARDFIKNALKQGVSKSSLADALAHHGYKPRGKRWHLTTIGRIAQSMGL